MLLHGLSVSEALSGIFGSVSLTAWICLLVPQLVANYKAGSAEGLSMGFLAIWLFGDVTNLSGALVTGLAPTATLLSGYFCISDIILITQCVYYNMRNAHRARQRGYSGSSGASDEQPLLRRSSTSLSASRRRHYESSNPESIKRVVTGEDEMQNSNNWASNTIGVMAIYLVGIAGWFISYRFGAWDKPDGGNVTDPTSPTSLSGIVLGYISAVCYLCARIPQIVKNYKEKSCEGLALLFFMFSLTGNLTYGFSVFSYSQDSDYLVKATPWLIGSFGTIVEDCIIFYQFHIYSRRRGDEANSGYDSP